MTESWWPWWVGGPLLAVVALLFPLLNRAPLGVSGALARLLPRKPGLAGAAASTKAGCGSPAATATKGREHLIFLVAVALGGALAGWVGGRPWGVPSFAQEYHALFGSGFKALVIAFGGGVLIGFGTRLSGGCTSGHGLSGCGRLQPASLVATGIFFGVAIGVSYLLEALAK